MKRATKQAVGSFILFVSLCIPLAYACADEASTTPEMVTLSIRDNGQLVGPFVVPLPDSGSAPIAASATGDSVTHDISARSVLAALLATEATTTSFSITDLQYYSSFGSFIVNCIFVPVANSSADCNNWTYAVNGSYPAIGMDTYSLQKNDLVYVIFGSEWRISVDAPAATTGQPVGVTAEKYDASSGLYVPAVGEVVGAVQFDSNYAAVEFATSTVDSGGRASLMLGNAGEYSVGIASSGYFPNTTLSVSTSTPPATTRAGGAAEAVAPSQFSVPAALSYLESAKQNDGSFGSLFLTDWAALAFVAADAREQASSLQNYFSTRPLAPENITDYERHAMALEALGIDPYAGANYILPIVLAFDGTQIGDVHLDNDDIFALFPLLHVGYTADDQLIQKVVSFVLLAQNANGSWDGSVDMTAAAVQSLNQVHNLPGVADAITRAAEYVRSQRTADGGFGNSFSTSWALQALAAVGDTSFAESAGHSLAALQQTDGGLESSASAAQTRVWSTEYAIPAALQKPWGSLLRSFPKPDLPIIANEAAPSAPPPPAATTTTPTSTTTLPALPISLASTTPPQTVPTTEASTTVRRVQKLKLYVKNPPQPAAVLLSTEKGSGLVYSLWHRLISFFLKLW